MNTTNLQQKIFKKGSVTYYYSSLYFPKHIREDVFTLYAYVRTADNFVDTIPQKKKDFYKFKELSCKAFEKNKLTGNKVIDDFACLLKNRNIPKKYVYSFLTAMESDITKRKYKSFKDLNLYMYGSANVIGLIMAHIMQLPKESQKYAELLGKAMQYVNFIRDINEDISLGRIYIPHSELITHNLTYNEFLQHTNVSKMKELIRSQINIFRNIQAEAEKGFKYIPTRYRIPIQTASNLYKWTADKIYNDPMIVFAKKVKPSPYHVMKEALFVWTSLI